MTPRERRGRPAGPRGSGPPRGRSGPARPPEIDPARLAAMELLTAVRVRDAYANLALPAILRRHRLRDRDAALATELVARDPLDHQAQELLIRCLARSGRRADAERQVAACEALLGQELGIAPGQTDASGTPNDLNPGDQGAAQVRQGALEASNVEPVQELIDLITTQRAFELNSQVVQAGDQIMQVAANLRRF